MITSLTLRLTRTLRYPVYGNDTSILVWSSMTVPVYRETRRCLLYIHCRRDAYSHRWSLRVTTIATYAASVGLSFEILTIQSLRSQYATERIVRWALPVISVQNNGLFTISLCARVRGRSTRASALVDSLQLQASGGRVIFDTYVSKHGTLSVCLSRRNKRWKTNEKMIRDMAWKNEKYVPFVIRKLLKNQRVFPSCTMCDGNERWLEIVRFVFSINHGKLVLILIRTPPPPPLHAIGRVERGGKNFRKVIVIHAGYGREYNRTRFVRNRFLRGDRKPFFRPIWFSFVRRKRKRVPRYLLPSPPPHQQWSSGLTQGGEKRGKKLTKKKNYRDIFHSGRTHTNDV